MHSIVQILVGIAMMIGVLVAGAGAAVQGGEETTLNTSLAAEEIGLQAKPVLQEIPPMPDGLDAVQTDATGITGTGNLTKLIEVNNTAGEYAFELLQVTGTNATSWDYQAESANTTGNCYTWITARVTNAEKILLEGHAVTADLHVAYAGAGLSDPEWKEAGPYSGQLMIMTATRENMSSAWMIVENEQGTISHLTRSYHVINGTSSQSELSGLVPGIEWAPEKNETDQAEAVFFYDQYGGSYLHVNKGSTGLYHSFASSGSGGARAVQILSSGAGKSLVSNTLGEEWPSGDVHQAGRGSFEQFRATNATSVDHFGQALFTKGNFGANGASKGTAESLDYQVSPSDSKREPVFAAGYAGGMAMGITQRGGRISIPASYDGWMSAVSKNNHTTLYEQTTSSGAYLERYAEGGIYDRVTGTAMTGVLSTISSGKKTGATTPSQLNGILRCDIDQTAANATTLEGRWMVTSDQGSPLARLTRAVMPGRSAYSTAETFTGSKYVKERAYYRDGMVDAQ